jgi:hypothetical protein
MFELKPVDRNVLAIQCSVQFSWNKEFQMWTADEAWRPSLPAIWRHLLGIKERPPLDCQ